MVHIDVDPMVVGAAYPLAAALVGDARLCLSMLRTEASERLNGVPRAFDDIERLSLLKREKRARFVALAEAMATPIRPERVLAALQTVLPADAVIVADPGTPCPYVSGHFDFNRSGRDFITNRAHGALGFALPASIGAAIGAPNAKVVSLMGDGSFGFSVGELETAVRLSLPITFIVFSNASFGWIKASQKAGYDARYFSVDFTRTEHAAIAAAYGLRTWRVEDPADVSPAIRAAILDDGPTLVDIIAQPLEESAVPVSRWMG